MRHPATLADPGRRSVVLLGHVATVTTAGLLVVVGLLSLVDLPAAVHGAPPAVWALALGLLVGELVVLPAVRADEQTSDVTMSATFAVAMVVTGPLALLLLVHTVSTVTEDLRTRRPLVKTVFNAGQSALALVAARAVFCAIAGQPLLGGFTALHVSDLAAVAAAGCTFVAVNTVLVAVAVGLSTGHPTLAVLGTDLRFKLETSAVLLGMAPVAAVLAQTSGWLLPLLALPMIAVRRSAALARSRHRQAMRDGLTGLGNRELFFARTERLVSRRRADEPLAVLLIDLDHFKDVNDTLGHQIGDRVLQTVGRRIADVGERGSVVARLGGDEFAITLPGVDADLAAACAQELLVGIVRPLQVGSTRMVIQASVGIAMAEPGLDANQLVQRADIALYEAKRERARWCLFDPACAPTTPERLGLLADLRDAIDRQQISVHFQPQVSLSDGRVVGAEALARWEHPERGPVPPEEFIALAEHAGLIHQVTELVLEETLAALADWQQAGLICPVAVNLSARQLADLSLPDQLRSALERHGVVAGHLTAEVTESSIMGDPRRAGVILQALRQQGIRIAVDDFGTGYSSLAYLQRLDLDELKIDRSFVQSMAAVARDDVLVRSIIELAHNLGLTVIAEGVEDAAQVERLRELECDAAQGFHLGRPMDRDLMTSWLRRDLLAVAEDSPGLAPGTPHLRVLPSAFG